MIDKAKHAKILFSARVIIWYVDKIKEETGLNDSTISKHLGRKQNYLSNIRIFVRTERSYIYGVGIGMLAHLYLLYEVPFSLEEFITSNGINLSQFDKVNSPTN